MIIWLGWASQGDFEGLEDGMGLQQDSDRVFDGEEKSFYVTLYYQVPHIISNPGRLTESNPKVI